jgi:hypothetical protein
VPGVEYRITVWAVDMLGTPGEEREVLVQTDQQTAQQPTRLIILGPETARVDTELRAEAKLVTCDPRGLPPARIKVRKFSRKFKTFSKACAECTFHLFFAIRVKKFCSNTLAVHFLRALLT